MKEKDVFLRGDWCRVGFVTPYQTKRKTLSKCDLNVLHVLAREAKPLTGYFLDKKVIIGFSHGSIHNSLNKLEGEGLVTVVEKRVEKGRYTKWFRITRNGFIVFLSAWKQVNRDVIMRIDKALRALKERQLDLLPLITKYLDDFIDAVGKERFYSALTKVARAQDGKRYYPYKYPSKYLGIEDRTILIPEDDVVVTFSLKEMPDRLKPNLKMLQLLATNEDLLEEYRWIYILPRYDLIDFFLSLFYLQKDVVDYKHRILMAAKGVIEEGALREITTDEEWREVMEEMRAIESSVRKGTYIGKDFLGIKKDIEAPRESKEPPDDFEVRVINELLWRT